MIKLLKLYVILVSVLLTGCVARAGHDMNVVITDGSDAPLLSESEKDSQEPVVHIPVDTEELQIETEAEEQKETSAETENIEETSEEVHVAETEEAEEYFSISEKMNYSEDDLYYLAAVVCSEAGCGSEEIQLLVANVVINRVQSSIYPNTIYEVLTQPRQYGVMWRDGISFPRWATDEIKEQCYYVARRILDGERHCPGNVLFQAEFEQGNGIYKLIDGYYFCYY